MSQMIPNWKCGPIRLLAAHVDSVNLSCLVLQPRVWRTSPCCTKPMVCAGDDTEDVCSLEVQRWPLMPPTNLLYKPKYYVVFCYEIIIYV